ncbi:MAG: hypothetical protein H7296_07900 [Bacteroidia bacterium]|nr:hypothetical protein [Bacteroidia bacterium]
MKKIVFLVLSAVIILSFSMCRKHNIVTVDQEAANSNINLVFSNMVDGVPITLGSMINTNAAGNKYRVDVLKYYISNIKLVKADATEISFDNYELINEAEAATKIVVLKNVPHTSFVKIRFYLGIDLSRNHTGLQDGDLDPAHDMIWDWNTGYIFFKHEGKFINTQGTTKILVQHLATDFALPAIEVPLNNVTISSGSKIIELNFNLNSAYTSPTNIDFNINGMRTSIGALEMQWMSEVKNNMYDAFTFAKFE